MEKDCIFCNIVSGNEESNKVLESENFVVIRDAFPKMEGHSLVVSKKHFRDFMDMDSSLSVELIDLVKELCRKEGWEDFNLVTNNGGAAGQIIWHLHFHVLPRRRSDGFRFGI